MTFFPVIIAMASVTRSSKALFILDNILLTDDPTSQIYDQIKALCPKQRGKALPAHEIGTNGDENGYGYSLFVSYKSRVWL